VLLSLLISVEIFKLINLMKKLALLLIALYSIVRISYCQEIPASALYLGQTSPGSTPKIFAPGIVSITGRNENVITFSPDGTQIFFDAGTWPNRTVMFMEYKNGAFTSPIAATFSTTQRPGEPSFSPNGKRIYYYAFNPANSANTNLCYSEKPDTSWGSTINLGGPLNSSSDEYHPCVVNDTSVYFTSGSGLICRSQYKNGVYEPRIALPSVINAGVSYGDTYVSPDERYLIFNLTKSTGFGNIDLYISYKKENGSWTNPKNLGDKINTSAAEAGGDITPDGKYMTFTRSGDLYWVSANFIDSLKHTNYVPYLKSSIKVQTDTVSHSYFYQFADSTFIDDDGNNTLSYTASLDDGTPLPSWLTFNAETRTLSGVPISKGTFKIKMTVTDTANASVSASFNLIIKDTPASLDQNQKQLVSIFPNPSTGMFVMTLIKPDQQTDIEIYNCLGKLVFSKRIRDKTSEIIDLSGQSKGIYLVKSWTDGKVFKQKITIE
jgi:hypothetical protein